MNFKNFFYLIIIGSLFGCGVKSNPLSPPETAIPSFVNSYTGTDSLPIVPATYKKK